MSNEKRPPGPPTSTQPSDEEDRSPYAPPPAGAPRTPYAPLGQHSSPFTSTLQQPSVATPASSKYAPPGLREAAPPFPGEPPPSPYAPPGSREPASGLQPPRESPYAPPSRREVSQPVAAPAAPPRESPYAPPGLAPPSEPEVSPFARPREIAPAPPAVMAPAPAPPAPIGRPVGPPGPRPSAPHTSPFSPPNTPLEPVAPLPFTRPDASTLGPQAPSPFARPRTSGEAPAHSPAPSTIAAPESTAPTTTSPFAPPATTSPFAPPASTETNDTLTSPSPFASPPSGPHDSPYAPRATPSPFSAYVAPPASQPYAPDTSPPPDAAAGMTLERAAMRAVRMRIEPDEVTPSEYEALQRANITDPLVMAFLAWRRAVLLLVAIALVPLTLLRVGDAFDGNTPPTLRFLYLIPALAEGSLCAVCWMQLVHWTRWPKQRRALVLGWLAVMAATFAVYLIPIDAVISKDTSRLQAESHKLAAGVAALLVLAPKAVSLLAGAVRAGLVTKMLFAGASGPGWVIVLAAPIYIVFVFMLVIVPFQITGNGWFFGALVALIVAQVMLGRAGLALARPTTHDDAVAIVGRARLVHVIAMVLFATCLLVALGTYAKSIGVLSILTTLLAFAINVLFVSLIGTDLLIANLERSRSLAPSTAHVTEESNVRLAAFADVQKSP